MMSLRLTYEIEKVTVFTYLYLHRNEMYSNVPIYNPELSFASR